MKYVTKCQKLSNIFISIKYIINKLKYMLENFKMKIKEKIKWFFVKQHSKNEEYCWAKMISWVMEPNSKILDFLNEDFRKKTFAIMEDCDMCGRCPELEILKGVKK